MSAYPEGFHGWPLDRQNAHFANEARKYRKGAANGNGHPETEAFNSDERPAVVNLSCASDIRPEPISWLWRDWLARGKMHIIAGQPGVGKSTIAMKIAAAVSAGGRWPDGSTAKQGNVVIWSSENDPADTLVPHLEASGGDVDRVFFVSDVITGKDRRPFDPAKDMPALQAAIKAAGGAALIIIDPIVSATTRTAIRTARRDAGFNLSSTWHRRSTPRSWELRISRKARKGARPLTA